MPFALGVAIAALFQRIADLLTLPPWPGYIPPGGGDDTPGTGPGPDDGGDNDEPTVGGSPTYNPRDPVTVPVDDGDDGDDGSDCPPLNSVAMATLANLPNLVPQAFLSDSQIAYSTASTATAATQETDVPANTGQGIIVEDADFFRFRAYGSVSNVTVSFFGRVQGTDGNIRPFNHTLTPDNTGTVFQIFPRPGPGYLLGAAASVPPNSITTGSMNAIGEVGRIQGSDFTPHTLLFGGQLDGVQPLSTSLASPQAPLVRPTYRSSDSLASAASPKEFNLTPLPNRSIRILRVFSQVTTDATALARAIQVSIVIGAVAVWRCYGDDLLTASQSGQINGSIGGSPNTATDDKANNGPILQIPLPESLYLWEPFTLQVVIQNGASGDRLSQTVVRWEDV